MALVKGVNAFATVTEANTYFNDNLQFSSWDNLTATVKTRALITSASQINLSISDGCKLPLNEADIIEELTNANIELALAMALNPAIVTQADTGSNTKRVKAGSAEVEFFRPKAGTRFPPTVMNLLISSGCLAGATGIGVAGVGGAYASGTNVQSTFANIDEYGLEEGYP